MLLKTLDITVSIQRGKKLGYALPMRTDYEETQNLKRYNVKDCPYHTNKDIIFKRINGLKSIHKLFLVKSETNDGLSSCSNFPERPSSYELESDKPVSPEIENCRRRTERRPDSHVNWSCTSGRGYTSACATRQPLFKD